MSAEAPTVTLLGLPGAGKTTYLAAFYIEAERPDATADVRITRYTAGQREYLNELADRLADRKNVERTSQEQPGELRLPLAFATSEGERLLTVPDVSGELLRDGMERRVLPAEIVEPLRASDGALLFVRPDQLVEAVEVGGLAELLEFAPVKGVDGLQPEDWSLDLAATQARLVDVVQEVLDARERLPLRLAVVVSAWDTVGEDMTPDRWAGENLALLVQLLQSDPRVQFAVFGVSAQGGDFERDDDVERLKPMPLAERGFAVRGDRPDRVVVTAPLRWVLGV